MMPLMLFAQNDTDSSASGETPESSTTTMLGTYYADRFVGRKTSCGEIFRQNQYTAAHRTYPFGTYLLVTYPVTSQQVVVRVNDRCPKQGVLDMTKLAVHALGIKGSGKVTVSVIEPAIGHLLWSKQDTLAMTESEYYAYRDRSKSRRISPWPININDPTQPASRNSQPKPTSGKAKGTLQKTVEPKDEVAEDTLPPLDDPIIEEPPIKGPRFDIELCTVNSQQAANNEAKRLPEDLQNKVVFDRNLQNKQVRIILAIADSRSHAVRTQAMLIEKFPESCIIQHE